MLGVWSFVVALLELPWLFVGLICAWLFVFGDRPTTPGQNWQLAAILMVPSFVAFLLACITLLISKHRSSRSYAWAALAVEAVYAIAVLYGTGFRLRDWL